MEISPGGDFDRYTVAQSFDVLLDYADITGQIGLSAVAARFDDPRPVLTLSLATDEDGQPGATFATTTIAQTSLNWALYDFAFAGATLKDATRYWLVASAADVRTGLGTVPSWPTSEAIGPPMGYRHNDEPWSILPLQAFAVAINGTVLGDSSPDAPPPFIVHRVPEPATLPLLGLGIALAAWRRRS
jgi:hypothetical protein